MDLAQLITQLKLNPKQIKPAKYLAGHTHAAVLVPIVETQNKTLEIWLTKRPEYLKHHPGQVSFPGGKLEANDSSLYACALRETDEEIGISPTFWQHISTLSSINTLTGFEVTPFVALSRHEQVENFKLKLNKNEVAELIRLPLDNFLYQINMQTIDYHRADTVRRVYGFYFQDKLIWGATATILHELKQRLLI
ncbi:CoA pyrophosphatase [Catenovulum sp. 2E275]|uniref:CoA pyrophosphatase n=1 Tax=Catenovulum sp. 2E275 TaxID=2980497 RepID=UPI0021CF2E1C|nr:CoA pyrophosphatase [Catenovulum sp. 2E275]MCU4674445.1 CoA pyrophosphatase [Catenovulum sp. 2E275]